MPRVFIGWSLPAGLRDEIGVIVSTLRTLLPSASWTRSETYHLTFAFLGDQDSEAIDKLGRGLVESMRDRHPARTAIGEAGFFPPARRPRVGWLGLSDPEPVEQIARAARQVLNDEGISLDDKPFHPHLTIARPRARWGADDVERFLRAWQPLRGYPLLVDSVALFESRLGSGGARHIPLAVARCTGERRDCSIA